MGETFDLFCVPFDMDLIEAYDTPDSFCMAAAVRKPQERQFEPYTLNGGTCIGVAGKDYAIIAADTRMSEGYSIKTRYKSKCAKLTSHCVLASSGMQADVPALHKTLNAQTEWFEHQHRKEMPLRSASQLLSTMPWARLKRSNGRPMGQDSS